MNMSTTPGDAPLFDYPALLDRLSGNQKLATALIQGFLTDMPDQLSKLMEAWNSGSREDTAAATHRIKGAAANIGAGQLHRAVLSLELAVKSPEELQSERLGRLVSAVTHAFEQLRPEMLRRVS